VPYHCHACSLPSSSLTPLPLPIYNSELASDLCPTCHLAQGVSTEIGMSCAMYEVERYQRRACEEGRRLALACVEEHGDAGSGPDSPPSHPAGSSPPSLENSWEEIPPPPSSSAPVLVSSPSPSTSSLLSLLKTPGFLTLRRRSRCLDIACQNLLSHRSSVAEFLSDLAAPATPQVLGEVAQDMSTAIRLLHNLASDGSSPADAAASVPLFHALMAFLLSLSADALGQLATFFVQIKQVRAPFPVFYIHLL
jgi:hypothetical protein